MKTMKFIFAGAMLIVAFLLGSAFNSYQGMHPEMNGAKKLLIEAKGKLEKATKDYDGYRLKAIDKVKDAIEDIDKGLLAADKK